MNPLLDTTQLTVRLSTYPGYPEERLVVTNPDSLDNMTLPDGMWSTSINTLPSLYEQQRLRDDGYELDNFGRPLHPWLREMLTNTEVGVVTGLGKYWHWGPNRAADPIVINTDDIPKVLLIKRGDTGAWALPGGFIDVNESGSEAARRELCEEAGFVITGEPLEVYNGAVADARTTAHAWAETVAVLWQIDGTPAVRGNDDATDAQWFALDNLPPNLHGSHEILIQKAAVRLHEVSMVHTLEFPSPVQSFSEAKGGHMSYHRLIATMTDGSKLFVKGHGKEAFNYPIPEAHSLQYLQKEKLMYDHILRHSDSLTPKSVDILHGRSLLMEALPVEDGWHWRAPKTNVDTYIRNTIQALEKLQQLPLPESFHDTILPTYQTHIHEGWRVIDDETTHKISRKVTEFTERMREDFRESARLLVDDLGRLQSEFYTLPFPDKLHMAHHDIRQANIAWHPNHGTRIVDWSWAGAGRQNSDITTLLIDLHKSGHDVQPYMHLFNDDHALTLIGFWLAHSLWPTRSSNDTVRFHQVVSAVSAYILLKNL